MLDVDIGFFKRAPFFSDFAVEPLRLIAFSADVIDLADGEILFTQGEPSASGYVLVHGHLDLFQDGPTGRALVETVEPGTLLGELALLVETRRPASAVAVGSARVYEISRKLFRRVLQEYPAITKALRAQILARVAALAPDLADLAARIGPAGPDDADAAATEGQEGADAPADAEQEPLPEAA